MAPPKAMWSGWVAGPGWCLGVVRGLLGWPSGRLPARTHSGWDPYREVGEAGHGEAGCDGPTGCASVQCGAQAGTFQLISEGEEALFLFEGIAHAEYTLVVLDFGLSNSKMSLYNTDMVELASNDIQQDIDASNYMSRLSSWECPETSVYIVGVRGHTASCACPDQPSPAPHVHSSAF